MTSRWTTRPEAADDVSVIREINLAAFPTADEADLVEALREDDAWLDGLSIVTEDSEGAVVGHALLTRCFVGGRPGPGTRRVLPPLRFCPGLHVRDSGGLRCA